ncbi:hypothetical protein D3C87_1783460 [compost metagenome]
MQLRTFQNSISCRSKRIGIFCNTNAYITLLEGTGIIQSVTDHTHHITLFLQLLHISQFIMWLLLKIQTNTRAGYLLQQFGLVWHIAGKH